MHYITWNVKVKIKTKPGFKKRQGGDSKHHPILSGPGPCTAVRSPINPLLSHQRLYDRPHPTELRFRLTSQWGAGASLLQAPFHGCALCPPPTRSTPPGWDRPFLYFGWARAPTGRNGEGPSSCPTALQSPSESLPTKTALLHIAHFCIWMSEPLSSFKCTLNLSGNNREEAHAFFPTLIN